MAVLAGPTIEALNGIGNVGYRDVSVLVDVLLDPFLLRAAKGDSATALSQQLPFRLMLGLRWFDLQNRFHASQPYCVPLIRMGEGAPRVPMPLGHHDASSTSSRWTIALAAHPTIFRGNRFITTARYSQPCQVRMYVISVTQAFGRLASLGPGLMAVCAAHSTAVEVRKAEPPAALGNLSRADAWAREDPAEIRRRSILGWLMHRRRRVVTAAVRFRKGFSGQA